MDTSFSPCGLDSMGELNSQLSTAAATRLGAAGRATVAVAERSKVLDVVGFGGLCCCGNWS